MKMGELEERGGQGIGDYRICKNSDNIIQLSAFCIPMKQTPLCF